MDNGLFNKKIVNINSNSLADSKYKHVLLLDGADECYYDVGNGNLYAKTITNDVMDIDLSSPLLIDYSSSKTKVMFDEAAKRSDWKTLYEHTKFLINFNDSNAWFSFQFIPYDRHYLTRPFMIITAFNPYMNGKDRTCKENLMANNELFVMLKEMKYDFLPSMGELSGYCEASYIVYDIPLKKALELGNIYEQESIVFNNGKIVTVVDCKTSKNIIELNHFEVYENGERDI